MNAKFCYQAMNSSLRNRQAIIDNQIVTVRIDHKSIKVLVLLPNNNRVWVSRKDVLANLID